MRSSLETLFGPPFQGGRLRGAASPGPPSGLADSPQASLPWAIRVSGFQPLEVWGGGRAFNRSTLRERRGMRIAEAQTGRRTGETHKLRRGDEKRREPSKCGMRI